MLILNKLSQLLQTRNVISPKLKILHFEAGSF